jgi:hypothetical protein
MLSESMNPYGSEDPAELERIREIGNRAMSSSYDMPYYDWVPGYEDALASARGMYNPYLDKTAAYNPYAQAGPWSGAGYGVQNHMDDKLALSNPGIAALVFKNGMRDMLYGAGRIGKAGNFRQYSDDLAAMLVNRPMLAKRMAQQGSNSVSAHLINMANKAASGGAYGKTMLSKYPGLADANDYITMGSRYIQNNLL